MDNSRFKFRVWNTEINKMITNVKEMGVFALQSIYSIDEFLVIPTNEKYPLMQYTGLKDKNGVEIYEGDIVKITQHFAYSNNESFNAIIDFEYFSFNAVLKSKGYETLDKLISLNHEFEVIGNIYENRELLND